MKKRPVLTGVLVLTGALGVFLALRGLYAPLFGFPLHLIGRGLRQLSLSGRFGNGLATALYTGVGLLPVLFLVNRRRVRKKAPEDLLLVLLSGLLFLILYWMINPGVFSGLVAFPADTAVRLLGLVPWSVFAAFVILRTVRTAKESGGGVFRQMRVFLGICAAYFVLVITLSVFGQNANGAILLTENAGGAGAVEWGMLGLGFFVYSLPSAMMIVAVYRGLDLTEFVAKDRYSEETARAAGRLSDWAAKTLAAGVLSQVAYQILQLLFLSQLTRVHFSFEIPLCSVLFALAALLLARSAEETRVLKQEHDLFI